jgi:hypothetical protein
MILEPWSSEEPTLVMRGWDAPPLVHMQEGWWRRLRRRLAWWLAALSDRVAP